VVHGGESDDEGFFFGDVLDSYVCFSIIDVDVLMYLIRTCEYVQYLSVKTLLCIHVVREDRVDESGHEVHLCVHMKYRPGVCVYAMLIHRELLFNTLQHTCNTLQQTVHITYRTGVCMCAMLIHICMCIM